MMPSLTKLEMLHAGLSNFNKISAVVKEVTTQVAMHPSPNRSSEYSSEAWGDTC